MVYNVSRKTQYVSLFGLSVLKYAEYPTAYYTQRLNIVTEQKPSISVKLKEQGYCYGVRHKCQHDFTVNINKYNHYLRYEHKRHQRNECKNL